MKYNISKQDMIDCHNRIKPFIHRTPVMTSRMINDLIGLEVYFKCENFQKAGAYKMRGALNAILQLSNKEKDRGVTTHSSGNFAQAVSYAAKSQNVKAYIVMPTSAPKVKMAGVKSYDGEIILCKPTLEAREFAAAQIVREKGATFLHPSNDLAVITGQGTSAMELIEDHGDLDAIFCPVGGGGLIAGSALAAHYFSDNIEVYGGEPHNVDDGKRSLESGQIETNKTAYTIADGLKTQLGNHNFPIIKNLVKDIFLVEENEIVEALKLVWERMKIIIEPSSAVTFAALIKNKDKFRNKKVGIIVSGGNVDLQPMYDHYYELIKSFEHDAS